VCGSRARAGRAGGREEVRTYQTMTRWLLVMADRLAELGVTRVVMEATSDYWKGVFCLLEAHGFEGWLVNARDVKHLPGRPKTDTLDAVWLCKLAERQMLRPSFVPPRPIRQLREVTRYRADLVAARTAEKQRVEQAAGGRPDQAVGGGQRHLGGVGAGHAGRAGGWGARPQGPQPGWPVPGCAPNSVHWRRCSPGSSPTSMPSCSPRCWLRVDALDADLADLDTKLADAVDRLDEIPGLGQLAGQLLIAELGTDMTRFPTAGQLVSWAKFAPGVSESAGKRKGRGSTGHGNP
jgi:transposase